MIPVAILIVVAIAGIIYYFQNYDKNAKSPIISEKKLELSAEEKTKIESRLAEVMKKIEEPPKEATEIDKYRSKINLV